MEIEGVLYKLIDNSEVNNYVKRVADEEWEAEDFSKWGEDIRNSNWQLKEIGVSDVKTREDLLKSKKFMDDLNQRINVIVKMISDRKPIPPLILRGQDMLIFDGYARIHAFKKLGINKCLAYVGKKREN